MQNIPNTDTINGSDPIRQMTILTVDILLMFVSWQAIKLFQFLLLTISHKERWAAAYFHGTYYVPVTLAMWAILWITLFANKGIVFVPPNHVQASDNPLNRHLFDDGATQFYAYSNISLTYLWEKKEGMPVSIEKEDSCLGDETTITIGGIGTVVKISGMWRVYKPRLSAFLQNHIHKGGTDKMWQHILAAINQNVETIAVQLCADSDILRANQDLITSTACTSLLSFTRKYGIELLSLKFQKCDFSSDTQKEMDKTIILQAVAKSAHDLREKAKNDGEEITMERAMELAMIAAGKTNKNISVSRIEMDPATAEALKNLPGAATLITAGTVLGNNQHGK